MAKNRRTEVPVLDPGEQLRLAEDFFDRVSYAEQDQWPDGVIAPDPDNGLYPEDQQ